MIIQIQNVYTGSDHDDDDDNIYVDDDIYMLIPTFLLGFKNPGTVHD